MGTRLVACLLLASACGDDASAEREPPTAEAPEPPEAARAPAELQTPTYPLIDESDLRRAPERYEHLVPRLTPPTGLRFRNLVYEANNMALRGQRNEHELYEDSGETIAERWREAAAGVERVFALRDALFSQQDHPIDHDPVAVMMPPSWITVAVAEVLEGRTPRPVAAPPLDDDEAWTQLRSTRDLFGVFPPSERLHETATRRRSVLAPERLRVTNARRTVHMLAAAAQRMIDAAEAGPEAVARAGADAIGDSDLVYFGRRLRRERVILISVENPNRHELVEEAKGLTVHGRDLPEEAVGLARRAIYERRLRDGDLAIERYNIARPAERARAIAVLEELLPEEGAVEGGDVWLWVNGGLDARGVRGRDAMPWISEFRTEVAQANVDTDRLHYLSKPHVPIGGRNLALKLDLASRRFADARLPLSLNLGSPLLARLIDENERRRERMEQIERAQQARQNERERQQRREQ